MKWNGIVSQPAHRAIAARFAPANASHATSTGLGRRNPVPRVAHGLDGAGAELLPQAADADVDDVRTRVEVVAPDSLEQLLTAHDLPGVANKVVEKAELTIRQIRDMAVDLCAAPGNVELERPGAENDFLVLARAGRP